MQNEQTPAAGPSLLPCPFCGGEAWLNDYEAKYSDLPPQSRAPQCRSCGASLGYLTTPAKAIAAWNNRPHVPSPASSSSVVQGDAGGMERETAAWEWLGRLYPNDAPSDLAYDANEMVDAFLAGTGRAARMAEALERIAGEQQYRSGYCQTDITVEPALTAEEAQTVARETLAQQAALRPQPSGETRDCPAGEREPEAVSRIIAGRPWSFSKDAVASKTDAILSLFRPAPVASSDQPEQGGGMEVVAWEYRTAPHRKWHWTDSATVAEQERKDGSEVVPRLVTVSSAEARARELSEERDSWRRVAERIQARATAAEAQLAKAKEAVQAAIDWDKARGYRMPYRVRDPLYAALQQAGEVG